MGLCSGSTFSARFWVLTDLPRFNRTRLRTIASLIDRFRGRLGYQPVDLTLTSQHIAQRRCDQLVVLPRKTLVSIARRTNENPISTIRLSAAIQASEFMCQMS